MDDWNRISKIIRSLIRAKEGLPEEDDIYQGLIHTVDDRERTNLDKPNVYRHAYLNILAAQGPDWAICGMLADEERHLFISEDGRRATEFINARKKEQEGPATTINLQNQPIQQEPKKKGLFRR